MKKTILSFLSIGSTMMLLAQQPTNSPENNIPPAKPENKTITTLNDPAAPVSTVKTTTTYSVTVPASVQTSFQAAYPTAGTVTWQQSGDWYRAKYKDENGRIVEASYREDGKTFTRMAGPVLKTYVPEEAVNKAIEMYGMNVYSIALVKGTNGDMYNVTVIENGESKTEWMNIDGSTVATPYRTETTEEVTNTNTAEPVTTPVTEPAPVINDNSTTPAEDGTQEDMVSPEQYDNLEPVIKEGEPSEVDESGRLNRDALNNGKGSDDVMPEYEYIY